MAAKSPTRITTQQFEQADGVGDWSAADDTASAKFETKSFARGVELIDAVAPLADALNHHPDIDLRYPHVTIRLTTHDVDGLSDLDVELARNISEAAARLGIGRVSG